MNYLLITLSILAIVCLLIYFLSNKSKKAIAIIGRLFLGSVFIFSGFVKLIDPLGTNYKFIDYFESFGLEKFLSLTLLLAIIMCVAEFLIGISLLFSAKIKTGSWAVLLFMLFFTPLTLYLAIKNPVPDCGCFGDAVKFNNWQTFWKNIIIDAFVVIVFISKNKIKFGFSQTLQWFIIIFASLFGTWLSLYCLMHLPIIDFLNWKVGARLVPENPKPLMYYATYKNKSTGEKKEFLSQKIPMDTNFLNNWKWDTTRIIDPNEIKYSGPSITDEDGNVVTDNFIKNPDYQFILVAYDLSKTNLKSFEKMSKFYLESIDNNYSFITLTSSTPEKVKTFKKQNKFNSEFYYSDDTGLKAMIRANPGLILLKNGVVIKKWHFNDFPTYDEFKDKFLKQSK